MELRIISGIFKGRAIHFPKGHAVRPTRGEVREALFNILGPRIQGAKVLDLFAGTGALGLEALSRGAREVVFAEREAACAEALRKTLAQIGIPQGVAVEVMEQDVFASLRRLGRDGKTFDLILADPPYEGAGARKSLKLVARYATLSPSGIMVVEGENKTEMPPQVQADTEPPRTLTQVRSVSYGDTTLKFYEWETEA